MIEEVAVTYVPAAIEIVPNVNRLADAVRRTGGKVFWIKQTVDEASSVAWSEWLNMMTPSVAIASSEILHRGRAVMRSTSRSK